MKSSCVVKCKGNNLLSQEIRRREHILFTPAELVTLMKFLLVKKETSSLFALQKASWESFSENEALSWPTETCN